MLMMLYLSQLYICDPNIATGILYILPPFLSYSAVVCLDQLSCARHPKSFQNTQHYTLVKNIKEVLFSPYRNRVLSTPSSIRLTLVIHTGEYYTSCSLQHYKDTSIHD